MNAVRVAPHAVRSLVAPASQTPASRRRWRVRRSFRLMSRRARFVTVAVILLLGVFTALALALRHAQGTAVDVAITRWVQQLDAPAFAALMVGVSALGYWPWSDLIRVGVVGGCLLAGWFWGSGWYRGALFVVVTQGAGWLASTIKLAIERPRPTSELVRVLGHVGETSYPSGHVTSYVAFYGLLFFLVYVLMGRGWLRTLLLTLFGLLIALVGVSRVYLGHHWASDVAGGYALGAAYLLLIVEAYRWWGMPEPKRRATSAPPHALP